MKKYLFLLIYFFLFQNINAQNGQWLAPNAQWEYYYGGWPNVGWGLIGVFQLSVNGTAMKGGELCTVLTGINYQEDHIDNTTHVYTDYKYYVFVRNDSFFQWKNDKFEVIYDFTRQIGDVIEEPTFGDSYTSAKLVEIGDTILLGNYATRFQKWQMINPDFVSPFYGEYAYAFEGIGGTTLLYWASDSPVTDGFGELHCYRDSIFNNPNCSFEVIVANKEPSFSSKIQLSPNPVTDFFTLDLPSEILPAALTITDVSSREINSFSQTETSQRFDFQGDRLDSGLYFLEIKGKNGVVFTRKFVH
jgi:Secretion system C-terminal sorting domain